MAKSSRAKSGGNKKHGRNTEKCRHYRAMHTREKNKLKRVLKSNGKEVAEEYARKHNLTTYLKKL